MKEFPFLMANLAPNHPPNPLQNAIGIAINQIIFPLLINKAKDPMFDAILTNLALADACRKSRPKTVMKANIRKLPVPGPIKPS